MTFNHGKIAASDAKETRMATAPTIQLRGLRVKEMTALTQKAKRLGMTPERYLRQLVQEDLALDRKVQTTSLAEIMGSSGPIDEAELDRIVDVARTRYHRLTNRKR
jgi:hypothetical protein